MFWYIMVCEAEALTPVTEIRRNDEKVLGIIQEWT